MKRTIKNIVELSNLSPKRWDDVLILSTNKVLKAVIIEAEDPWGGWNPEFVKRVKNSIFADKFFLMKGLKHILEYNDDKNSL